MNLKERLEALAQQATAWTTGTYEEQENNAHVVAAEARAIASELGRLAEEIRPRRFELEPMERWEADISTRTTSGHRISIDPVKVADLWKTLADTVSLLHRLDDLASALAPRKDRP